MKITLEEARNRINETLWAVYGHSCQPSILCFKVIAYERIGVIRKNKKELRKEDERAIWGHSVYKDKPGFRTLGTKLEWLVSSRGNSRKAHIFDSKKEAFEFLWSWVSEPGPKAIAPQKRIAELEDRCATLSRYTRELQRSRP